MAKNEAEGKVLEKVRDVEKEQGSFAEAGSGTGTTGTIRRRARGWRGIRCPAVRKTDGRPAVGGFGGVGRPAPNAGGAALSLTLSRRARELKTVGVGAYGPGEFWGSAEAAGGDSALAE